MTEPYRILSLDGGGIRGTATAAFLAELEESLGQPLHEAFDMIAGTSTGGLLALVISALKYDGQQCLKLYYENGEHIFDKSLLDMMLGKIQSDPIYDGIGKKTVCHDLLGHYKLSQIETPRTLITSFDIIHREAVIYDSAQPNEFQDPCLAEIANATSAAPIYFPTVYSNICDRWLVDGGLVANDPSMCAVVAALSSGIQADRIKLLSIGTGTPNRGTQTEKEKCAYGERSRGWGGFGWLTKGQLIEQIFAANGSLTNQFCKELLKDNFLRINSPLESGCKDDMDNVEKANLDALARMGRNWYRHNKDELSALLA